mgnify:CR=1 FL=1
MLDATISTEEIHNRFLEAKKGHEEWLEVQFLEACGMRLLCVSAVFCFASGCLGIRAGVQVYEMETAWSQLDEDQAQEHAPYEYALASQYRDKVWDALGYSKYGNAEDMAAKAMAHLSVARVQTASGEREQNLMEELEEDVELLPELSEEIPEDILELDDSSESEELDEVEVYDGPLLEEPGAEEFEEELLEGWSE